MDESRARRLFERLTSSSTAERLREGVQRTRDVARALELISSRRSHPPVDGSIEVAGSEGPIEVLRDDFGVPHVFARSEADALFGQGFVHAQDRLFQLEGARRLTAGRLAELAGPSLLGSDRFMRRLGLADRAGRDYASISVEERRLLDAYADGVNAGVRTLRALPPEFALLGLNPEPWHPEHSLLLGRLMLFSFASNWDTELLRERLVTALGPERTAEVDVAVAAGSTVTGAPPPAASRALAALEAAHAAGLPRVGASNAWAVAGSRSASGAPLLAGDPHVQASLPGIFHVCHIFGGGLDVIGAGIAGIPGIAVGHNGRVAWGLTAGLADTADCYLEAVDPADPSRYRTPEGWATGRTRIERIEVRGGDTVEERVLETRHGPIVGPALPGETRAVALRATALEAGELVGPFLDMARASNVWEFEAAVARWPGSTFNFVWAHRDGGIGYRLGGSVPQHAHGGGLLPQDGASSSGPPPPWPPEALPRLVDPAAGLVVSANNAPGGDLELGEEWCAPYRAMRIEELLRAREQHTVASSQAIQFDQRSEPLLTLRELLLASGCVRDAQLNALLDGWDGQAREDSAAAAVLGTLYDEVARALATRVAGPDAPTVLGRGLTPGGASSFHYRLHARVLEVLRAPRPPWLDDAVDRDRVLRAAFARTLAQLRGELGPDPFGWRWGDLHRLRFSHLLGSIPVVGRVLSRGPFPYGGDVNTVNQGGYSVHSGPGTTGFCAGYRQVIDLADVDRSTFGLPAGNSGIPGHPRYDDSIEEYLVGRQRPLLFTRAAIERHLEHRLELTPPAPASANGR